MTERRVVYLDASAVVKMVVEEPGSAELFEHLEARPSWVTSRVAEVEVRRAVARLGAIVAVDRDRVDRVLATLTMIELDASLAHAAGQLPPPALRSLDAIHLASALALGTELEALVTYDRRLGDAGTALGLRVIAPGASGS